MSKKRIFLYPLMTEKCMSISENENKLIFRVTMKANKNEIKKAIMDEFKVKIVNIDTLITPKGEKRAFIKLEKEHNAADIVANMGIL